MQRITFNRGRSFALRNLPLGDHLSDELVGVLAGQVVQGDISGYLHKDRPRPLELLDLLCLLGELSELDVLVWGVAEGLGHVSRHQHVILNQRLMTWLWSLFPRLCTAKKFADKIRDRI